MLCISIYNKEECIIILRDKREQIEYNLKPVYDLKSNPLI